MILPIKIEKNIIDYDVNVKKDECSFSETCTDEIYVYWNKKNWFGKVKRETTVYKFPRNFRWEMGMRVWDRSNLCVTFLNRIKEINIKENIILKLKNEFKGNDDFSLGVQHAISVLKEKGLI